MRAAIALGVMLATAPAVATASGGGQVGAGDHAPGDAFTLAFPVDCTLGDDCFIQQYVDLDPGPGVIDHACGPLSYDGHTGTDIALATLAEMAAGVAVLAAAPGQVVGLRDEIPDTGWDPSLEGRDCGNGVVIAHGQGWQTQYCHLMLGSVTVARGDMVQTGDTLGMIGLSGRTEFPHLHLTLRHRGQVVDPFAPDGTARCDAPAGQPTLWASPPEYVAGGWLDLGFATAVPEYDAIKAGTAQRDGLTRSAPAMVLWAYAFGARDGDTVRLRITGPAGEVIDHDLTKTRNRAQFFRAAGRRAPPGGWPAGTYTGSATLLRDDRVLDARQIEIKLD